jgi:hypothetical protein
MSRLDRGIQNRREVAVNLDLAGKPRDDARGANSRHPAIKFGSE